VKGLYDALGVVQIIAFALLGGLAILHWRRRGGAAAGWLAATFGSLAWVALVGAIFPEEVTSPALVWAGKFLLVVLAMFPFFLYKFMATFDQPARWLDNTAKVLTGAVACGALLMQDFPAPGEPLSAPLIGFLALFLTQWVFLSSVVAFRLWQGGKGLPGVARRRMRTLSLGAVGLALTLVISAISPTDDEATPMAIAITLLALATTPLFLLGFAPPRLIRLAWRREEELALRKAELELMRALDPAEIAGILLPSMCALVGGAGAMMRNSAGEIIGAYPPVEAPSEERKTGEPDDSSAGRGEAITVALRSGEIVVRASRFTPFFGSEEEQILKSLAVLADLAIARSELFVAEQRKNSFLRVLQQVTASANEPEDLRAAIQAALDTVCTETGWSAGHAYLVNKDPGRLEPTGIWHLDPALDFSQFKKATERMSFTAGEGTVGKVFGTGESLWVPDMGMDPGFTRRDYLSHPGAAAIVPIRVGKTVVGVLEFFASAPRDADPELLEVLTQIGVQLGRAIERSRGREELSRRAEELARSNADLEQFAYVASHDLQEPLRMVSSYMQLIAERYQGSLDETGERYIHYAVDGANRMQSLVRDLLSFSRVGSRGQDMLLTDLDEVLEQTLVNFQVAIKESGAVISHEHLPKVIGDAAQLTQLFQNLVGNAIKFRGAHQPEVLIQSELLPEEWLFSVKDNGVGFDPKYAERIFVIFKRLHGRDEYAGTGIGLAISKKIVERHGGRIWAESEPEKGTTIFFTLPIAEKMTG